MVKIRKRAYLIEIDTTIMQFTILNVINFRVLTVGAVSCYRQIYT